MMIKIDHHVHCFVHPTSQQQKQKHSIKQHNQNHPHSSIANTRKLEAPTKAWSRNKADKLKTLANLNPQTNLKIVICFSATLSSPKPSHLYECKAHWIQWNLIVRLNNLQFCPSRSPYTSSFTRLSILANSCIKWSSNVFFHLLQHISFSVSKVFKGFVCKCFTTKLLVILSVFGNHNKLSQIPCSKLTTMKPSQKS